MEAASSSFEAMVAQAFAGVQSFRVRSNGREPHLGPRVSVPRVNDLTGAILD